MLRFLENFCRNEAKVWFSVIGEISVTISNLTSTLSKTSM
jgi:hypothetical protein